MKKRSLLLLSVLTAFTLQANECVCFELKGEFGEEIKTILQKYTKNLGDKDIKIIKEDADLKKEQNFLDALVGVGNAPAGSSYSENGVVVGERTKNLYRVQCSSCHGSSAELVLGEKALNQYDKKAITNALFGYKDETYKGPARFAKQTAASSMTEADMESLAEYITTELKGNSTK